MSKDLKLLKQCILAKNKANLMLGIISRGVPYKSAEVISKLYKAYIRAHLEYCIQFWSPTNEKDADMLEGVQRRTTKMIPSFWKLIIRGKVEKVGYVFFKA